MGFGTRVEKGQKVQWAMQGRGLPSGAPPHPAAPPRRCQFPQGPRVTSAGCGGGREGELERLPATGETRRAQSGRSRDSGRV